MTRTLGRFFGPYICFSSISGAGVGFFLGALVTIGAFLAAIVTLLSGLTSGTTGQAALEIARAFPVFAQAVLMIVALGFACGFCAALIAALIGGMAGFWWSLAVGIGALCFVYPAYASGWQVDPTISFAIVVGTCGVLFALTFLVPNADRPAWAQSVGEFLSRSWLASPPQSARLAGIALPMLCYGIWEVQIVFPEYVKHPNYVARLGRWTTWQSSKRLAMSTGWSRRSSCQANLKQIGLGIKQYLQDYDEIYPPAPRTAQAGVGAVIQPYLKSTQLFQCPSEFYGPEKPDFASGDFTDYWFNARFYGLNEANLNFISNSVTWSDGNTGAGEANAAYSLRNLPPNWAPSMRHLGGANFAFADGHVKWSKPLAISNTAPASSTGYMLNP